MFQPTKFYQVPIAHRPQLAFNQARSDEIADFWERNGHGNSYGIYILGIRNKRGWLRIRYVGKAVDQTFSREAFTADKLARHYTTVFQQDGVVDLLNDSGKVVMAFFVYQHRSNTSVARNRISELERELIQLATIQYGDFLSNVQNRLTREWHVPGLTHFDGERVNGDDSDFYDRWASALGISNEIHNARGVRWLADHTEN